MIKECGNKLHVRLDKETLKAIRDGYWSKAWGCMEFLATSARSCDFDDVDDVVIINEKYVIEDTEDFDTLAAGKVLIIPECDHVADYADWWK